MLNWLKTYAKTHLFYLILIAVGVVVGRAWLSEHDARMASDAQVKQHQAEVATLQGQIKQQTAVAAQKVQVITRIVHDAQTPAQVVAAIPQLTNAPLNSRVVPALTPNAPDQVAVDAVPFAQLLGTCKQDSVNLGACQQNYLMCQRINTEKDAQIAALKQKPNFLHRVVSTLKIVAIGIGIGVVLGVHGL